MRIGITTVALALLVVAGPAATPHSSGADDTSALLAFARFPSLEARIFVARADGRDTRRVAAMDGLAADRDGGFTWSPDGRQIAFVRDLDIFVARADGSGVRSVTRSDVDPSTLAWSPNGRTIAFTGWSGPDPDDYDIKVVSAFGTGLRRVSRVGALSYDPPSWSPDGRSIAFTSGQTTSSEIHVIRADGSRLRRLTRNARWDTSPSWSPDGRAIVFQRDGSIWAMDSDGRRQRALGPGSNFEWSPSGKQLVFEFEGDLWIMDSQGRVERRLTRDGSDARYGHGQPAWSSNGQRIAFVSRARNDASQDIYVMAADGTGRRNVTDNRTREASPAWQPIG